MFLPLTFSDPPLKIGVPSCGVFLGPTDVTSSPDGDTGITVGVYFAVTGVPFLSTRLTVTPVATPVKFGSGTNVTVPSGATV